MPTGLFPHTWSTKGNKQSITLWTPSVKQHDRNMMPGSTGNYSTTESFFPTVMESRKTRIRASIEWTTADPAKARRVCVAFFTKCVVLGYCQEESVGGKKQTVQFSALVMHIDRCMIQPPEKGCVQQKDSIFWFK